VPLQKIQLKPGVNRENTRYTTEGGWYESDKVRFRQGTPEKIGGWLRISANTFLGVCRSLWNWVTLDSINLTGVGTNLKFYLERGGAYTDITPLRTYDYSTSLTNPFTTSLASALIQVTDAAHGAQAGDLVTFSGATATGGVPDTELNKQHTIVAPVTANTYYVLVTTPASSAVTGGGTVAAAYIIDAVTLLSNPFATVNGSTTITVTDANGGFSVNDFVTFSGSAAVNGVPAADINKEQQITRVVTAATYEIVVATAATSTGSGGGAVVLAAYQINTGSAYQVPSTGWGSGPWGYGVWGSGATSTSELRLWSQVNFGENLVFGPRYGGIYYWEASTGVNARGVNVNSLPGASNVPIVQQVLLISDASRFVMAFGTNAIGSTVLDPMLIRWSDQESVTEWTPAVTNQAGDLRLSHGSEISSVLQVRQEVLVWTDQSLYSMQYLGAPYVWGSQLMADNISIMGPNAVVVASGVSYWMGVDKFYKYSGNAQTMRCDLRQYIFSDFNYSQRYQVIAGTNEGFNEVWWFYCSSSSFVNDRYVVYNYLEDTWYYGNMGRTAWLDSGLNQYPVAATYANNLVCHDDSLCGKVFSSTTVDGYFVFASSLSATGLNSLHHLVELACPCFCRAVAQFRNNAGRNHELTICQSGRLHVTTNVRRDVIRHAITGATEQSATIRVAAQTGHTALSQRSNTAKSVVTNHTTASTRATTVTGSTPTAVSAAAAAITVTRHAAVAPTFNAKSHTTVRRRT